MQAVSRLLLADILETTLLNIPPGRSVTRVSASRILGQLRIAYPEIYCRVRRSDIARAIRDAYPIYRNAHRNAKVFKVSKRAAYEAMRKYSVRLRPREHAMNSILGKGVNLSLSGDLD